MMRRPIPITAAINAQRRVVMPGELPEQAKARWRREHEIEAAMDRDPSRYPFSDRKHPVRYDE